MKASEPYLVSFTGFSFRSRSKLWLVFVSLQFSRRALEILYQQWLVFTAVNSSCQFIYAPFCYCTFISLFFWLNSFCSPILTTGYRVFLLQRWPLASRVATTRTLAASTGLAAHSSCDVDFCPINGTSLETYVNTSNGFGCYEDPGHSIAVKHL